MRNASGLLLLTLLLTASPVPAGWEEGVAAFTSKKYQSAATEFQELVQQNPDGYRGHYMLGLSLEKLGRKEEALLHLRKAYDLNPNDLSIKMALGRGYKHVRRYRDVTQLLSSVDPSGLPGAQKAAFYQIRGEARFKTDDHSGAVQDFEQLAKQQPSNAQVQFLYGTTALKVGDTDKAVAALAKASSLDPKDSEMKRAYAQSLLKKGRQTRDKSAKKQSYLRASKVAAELAAGSASYDNLMLKISAEIGAGLYEQAVSTGQQALSKKQDDWLAHFYLGQAYTSSGQYSQAEQPLKDALARTNQPNEIKNVWTQLGYAYEKQKKYSDSISAYQNAGDEGGVARVQKNEETDRFNKQVEEENKLIKQMELEAKKLEEELQALEGGGGT